MPPESVLICGTNPQIRMGRVREMIVGELLGRQQAVDKTKTLLRTFAHGHSHRTVWRLTAH